MKFYNKLKTLTAFLLILLIALPMNLNFYAATITEPQIGADSLTSYFLKDDGTLWKTRVNDLLKVDENIKSFSVGYKYLMYIKNDGSLVAKGRNDYGQLGNGTTNTWYDSIGPLNPIGIDNVIQVVALSYTTFFLKSDGTIWKCGRSGTSTPTQIPDIANVKSIYANSEAEYTDKYIKPALIYIKNDNTAWALGSNEYGQLGIGQSNAYTPTYIMPNVAQVSMSERHTLFLKTDGTAWACGDNSSGQLGDNTTIDKYRPVKIMSDIKYVRANEFSSFFIKTDGSVWACGSNNAYELGDITNTKRLTPFQIPNMTDVIQISGGFLYNGFTLFLKENGEVWGCGENRPGALPLIGANNPQITPVLIIRLTDPPEINISTSFTDIGDNTDLNINITGKYIKKLCTINVVDTENNNIMYSQNIENLNFNETTSELNDSIVVPLNNAPEKDYNLEVRIINKKNSVLGTSNKIKINKNNVLNKILSKSSMEGGNSRFILMDDMGRHFDDNEQNRNIVHQIKEKSIGTYFVTNHISPVLYPLLEPK